MNLKINLQVNPWQREEANGPRLGINSIQMVCGAKGMPESLILGSRDSNIYVCDIREDSPSYFLGVGTEHTGWVTSVASLTEDLFITGSHDTSIKLWSKRNFEKTLIVSALQTYSIHKDYVQQVQVPTKNSKLFYSIALDKSIKKCDVEYGSSDDLLHVDPITVYNNDLYSSFCISSDQQGKIIAVGSPEKCIRILDVEGKKYVAKLVGHQDSIRCLSFDPNDDKFLFSGSSDGTIKLWDLRTCRLYNSWSFHNNCSIRSMDVTMGDTIFSADKNGSIISFKYKNKENEIENEANPITRNSCNGHIESIAFNPKRNCLYVTSGLSPHLEILSMNDPGPEPPNSSNYLESTSQVTDETFLSLDRRFVFYRQYGVNESRLEPGKRHFKYSKYDIMTGKTSPVKGHSNFENMHSLCFESDIGSWNPMWCSVDCKLGFPKIVLEESNIFNAEYYLEDIVENTQDSESRVNAGLYILYWLFKKRDMMEVMKPEDIKDANSPLWPMMPLFQIQSLSDDEGGRRRIWLSLETADYGSPQTLFHTNGWVEGLRKDLLRDSSILGNLSWIEKALFQHNNPIIMTSISSYTKVQVILSPYDPKIIPEGVRIDQTTLQVSAHPMLRVSKFVSFIGEKFATTLGLDTTFNIILYSNTGEKGLLLTNLDETVQSVKFRSHHSTKKPSNAPLEILYQIIKE